MSSELFDRNAYSILGLSPEASNAEVATAFSKAQAKRRAKPQQLGAARQELANVGTRLALDALTLTPPVPEAVLARVNARPEDMQPRPADVDVVEALLLLPEVELSVRNAQPPRLAMRADAFEREPIITPEIER
jgi:hypothetical protein